MVFITFLNLMVDARMRRFVIAVTKEDKNEKHFLKNFGLQQQGSVKGIS